jgi:hypothetical protein
MPKQLVTALGLIVSLGVIALGVFLVAVPLYFQAVAVDTQTAAVASTNAIYQTQVDSLRAEEANLDAINANVADLRSQIPASAQLDDVFEVVGRAAEASGVALSAVTAGEQVPFVVRTGATNEEGAESAPAPAPTPAPTEGAESTGGATSPEVAAPEASAESGRLQIDFVISATATDMQQATAFLDALRAGPRLLNSVIASSNQTGEGTVEVQINALTYIDAEG